MQLTFETSISRCECAEVFQINSLDWFNRIVRLVLADWSHSFGTPTIAENFIFSYTFVPPRSSNAPFINMPLSNSNLFGSEPCYFNHHLFTLPRMTHLINLTINQSLALQLIKQTRQFDQLLPEKSEKWKNGTGHVYQRYIIYDRLIRGFRRSMDYRAHSLEK